MARLSPFINPADTDFAAIAAGYTGQVPPVEKPELEKLLGRYKTGGNKITLPAAKGKTDRELYDMAASAVVTRFKEKQEEARKAAEEARQRAAQEAQRIAAEEAARRAAADQAQRAAAAAAAPTAPRISQPAPAVAPAATAAPARLTDTQVRAILASTGHPSWNPPSYARRSEADLRAWIKRAEDYAKSASTIQKTATTTTRTYTYSGGGSGGAGRILIR